MALTVTLVSAEQEVWHGEASLVVARSLEGEIGFMVGHERRWRSSPRVRCGSPSRTGRR